MTNRKTEGRPMVELVNRCGGWIDPTDPLSVHYFERGALNSLCGLVSVYRCNGRRRVLKWYQGCGLCRAKIEKRKRGF
jgi:hypothetical protein